MAQDLDAFLDESVYPALFNRLDMAFPEFGWTRSGSAWKATIWPGDFPDPANEQRPDRLMVYPDRPHWVKVHGHDGVRFLALVNGGRNPVGPEFLDAVRALSHRADVVFPERAVSDAEALKARARESRRSALDVVLGYAQAALWSPAGAEARAYLHGRGFTDEDLKTLGFGFYESAATVGTLFRQDHAELAAASEDAALTWKKLEGYVIIPWADAQGQPLTFYGRWPGTPPEGRPKTIALPGDGTKASPLYFDRARRAGHRALVAVEGVFDAALLQVKGDTRVVAYVSASFSKLQLETLSRFKVQSVIVQPDPDGGGDRGALSCVEGLADHGIRSFIAPRLPDGLDPDEFLNREGLDGWKTHVQGAVSGPLHKARTLLGAITPDNPPVARREAVERVLDYAATLPPDAALERGELLVEAALLTGFTADAMTEITEKRTRARQLEDADRELGALLREAEGVRAKGVLSVVPFLRAGLARVEARTISTPPAFSVDRLVAASKDTRPGRASGWETLDRPENDRGLGLQFHAGELALLAARTGHGKTSVLVGLLRNWLTGLSPHELVIFYSLEEPEIRVFHRLVALFTHEDRFGRYWTANEVRDYLKDPNSRTEFPPPTSLDAALQRLRDVEDRLLVVCRPSWTVAVLDAHARTVAASRSVVAVLVDYLQRLPGDGGSFDRRDLEVSAVARRLKSLAVDLGVPVVVGAQINRQATDGTKVPTGAYDDDKVQKAIQGRRPQLHQLREGGSEQEADLVLGLLNYRADYMEDADADRTAPDETLFEVGVLKSRYGAPGRWAALAFTGKFHVLKDPGRRP